MTSGPSYASVRLAAHNAHQFVVGRRGDQLVAAAGEVFEQFADVVGRIFVRGTGRNRAIDHAVVAVAAPSVKTGGIVVRWFPARCAGPTTLPS